MESLKLRIPSELKIGKKRYEIVYIDEFPGRPDIVGETRYDKKQIVLKNGQSKSDLQKTFFHELIHALSREYGAEVPHASIYILEEAIYDLLSKNKF